MAWETRAGCRYYYRSKRAGDTVSKVYLGSKDVARRAAEEDAAAKAKRAADKVALAEFEAQLAGADQLAAEVHRGVDVLVEATLLAIGYREHKGEWRRPRNE